MKEINEFERKIKKALELRIDTIECTSSKLKSDLNLEAGLEMKKIKQIEIGLEKLKMSKKIIKESLFTNIICEYYGLYEL